MSTKFEPTSFEYLELPFLRFIGIDAWRTKEDWGALWQRKQEFLPQLEQLSDYISLEMPYLCGFQHSANGTVNVEDHLVIGHFFRKDMPVPDGYDFMDFASQTVGYAVFDNVTLEHISRMQLYSITRDKILGDGKIVPYPEGYWHCEVYFKQAPLFDDDIPPFSCGYLFPAWNKNHPNYINSEAHREDLNI